MDCIRIRARRALGAAWPIVGPLLLAAAICHAADLQYRQRGNRFEGIKAAPVAGSDLELVSAMIDHRESASALAPVLRVRFFLDSQAKVFLTVRELDVPRHFYWLDRVSPDPARAWGPGFNNEFQWDTATVLRQLQPPLEVDGLGVLARIGTPDPGFDERVAPALLYHTSPPAEAAAYLFTVKPCCRSEVTFGIYAERGGAALSTETFPSAVGGRPLTYRWNARSAPKGAYKLEVTAFLLETNMPVKKVVHFRHEPRVE